MKSVCVVAVYTVCMLMLLLGTTKLGSINTRT